MITVLGATGNTGRRIAASLLARGEKVRAVGRDAARLASTSPAEACVGDAADETFLRGAFDGADAAYVLMPFDPFTAGYAEQQAAVGTTITAALRAARVPRVLALSSLGAEIPGGPDLEATGFLGSLHDQEERLRGLDADVTLLRSTLFLESFLHGLDAMRAEGVHADSIDPDVALPMVATRDVADVAVEELLRPPEGAGSRRSRRGGDDTAVDVREVLGAADRTVTDVVAALGPALGRPDLTYVRVPDAEMEAALRGVGLPEDVARLQVAMHRAFNEGRVGSLAGRGPLTTTPTTVAQWVAETIA